MNEILIKNRIVNSGAKTILFDSKIVDKYIEIAKENGNVCIIINENHEMLKDKLKLTKKSVSLKEMTVETGHEYVVNIKGIKVIKKNNLDDNKILVCNYFINESSGIEIYGEYYLIEHLMKT